MTRTSLADALAHGHGVERQFTCPVHRDEHPSASVNVAKGVWYCYRCHAHGTVDGAIYDDVDLDPFALVKDLAESDYEEFFPESWLDTFDAAGPGSYWLSRFEPETAAHFRLGYDAVADAATYPLRHPSNKLLGVVRRPLADPKTRYRYPARAKTTRLLFNYDPCVSSRVVLTEGATDAMAAWEVGHIAFATFSNRLSAEQARLLARVEPDEVVIAFDDDVAGDAGTVQVAGMLSHRYRLLRAHFDGAKDLAELALDDRKISLEQAVAL
jgi:DNA primase